MKRMTKTIKILSLCFALVFVLSLLTFSALALSWDGSSAGGGGGGTAAGPNGYAIRTTGDNCIGYRFSAVDKTGANKVAKVVDVFRNTAYGNSQYTAAYKFSTKYNKKQLINNQNAGFSTAKNTVNCYLESNCSFATALPAPNGMGTWQNYATNLNVILSLLNVGNISVLKNGDKILVEPIYDIRLEGSYHALTATEIAIYGKHILGASSNGGASSNSTSWGFIAPYTNRHYPNALFTPDGQGLWDGVSAATSQLTMYNIINKGYGVGIAYTETKVDFSPNLGVIKCDAWQGKKDTTELHYGTSIGSAFANWTLDRAYPRMNERIWYKMQFSSETENCYVQQTVWVEGGGTVSRKVYINDNTSYSVMLDPVVVEDSATHYVVKAREDWIDNKGNVLKYGAVKTFYIPVRPKINRYKVTAHSITGEVQAYTTGSTSDGMVYVGQKIRTSYTYTSDNTWTSYNDLWAAMQHWNGTDFVAINGADGVLRNAALNKSVSKEVDSKLGYTVVPDNSGGGWNHIPIKMTTCWTTDSTNTSESNWFDLSIVISDIALNAIHLVDDEGYYVDPQNLYAGQHLTVQYEYKSNTKCPLYVNGFNDDKSQIDGIFKVPARGSIYVEGKDFIVPDTRTFNIWGGVYLEGAGIYNTEWERNGTNNAKTLECKVNRRLDLVPIEPNAPYREKTDVVTSYWLVNSSSIDYIPGEGITVRFRAYKPNGALLYETQKDVIVPADDKNIAFFRWSVPEGYNGNNVKVEACIVYEGTEYKKSTNSYATVPYYMYTTPDTQFEKTAPAGFHVMTEPGENNTYISWWRYEYDGEDFYKTKFKLKIRDNSTVSVAPATGFSAAQTDRIWTMRSGYGISMTANPRYSYSNRVIYRSDPNTTLVGTDVVTDVEFTGAQYIVSTFPEYYFRVGEGVSRTLVKKNATATTWCFDVNGTYGRTHFIPLYFPDGSYYVSNFQSDCWTPAGMISNMALSNETKIEHSAYDDWYIGSR